ncbi:MAG TPA: ABC transporter substrate-binding protein [Candidatus Udaeobacter sp.]|nr:ABC transporter substrate-binding protein [Candidatus Udaeobacter sp.]
MTKTLGGRFFNARQFAICNFKSAIILGAMLFALCQSEAAQQQPRVPRVGILFMGGKDQPHLESLKKGLGELGYSEGKNIILAYRYAEGRNDRLQELVKEFVSSRVDVIVTTTSVSAQAARHATNTIPIVLTSGNPLQPGLADSLAKPGGNVTGLTVLPADLSGKRVELLKETFPKAHRIATLWSSRDQLSSVGFKETQDAAKAFAMQLYSMDLRNAEDIDKAFAELPKKHVDAVLVATSNPLVTLHSKRIVELALKHRLPGMYPTRQFVEESGLMAYGPLISDLYYRAATYIDKILKGAKPADLPIEQPTKFEFIINLKTAKQIGVTIPPNVLARADRVIR